MKNTRMGAKSIKIECYFPYRRQAIIHTEPPDKNLAMARIFKSKSSPNFGQHQNNIIRQEQITGNNYLVIFWILILIAPGPHKSAKNLLDINN